MSTATGQQGLAARGQVILSQVPRTPELTIALNIAICLPEMPDSAFAFLHIPSLIAPFIFSASHSFSLSRPFFYRFTPSAHFFTYILPVLAVASWSLISTRFHLFCIFWSYFFFSVVYLFFTPLQWIILNKKYSKQNWKRKIFKVEQSLITEQSWKFWSVYYKHLKHLKCQKLKYKNYTILNSKQFQIGYILNWII